MDQAVCISINWKQYRPGGAHPAQALLDSIHARLQQLRSNKMLDISAHVNADECTYVYSGCGSCADGGAKVEAYCSSSGGSRPDFSWCEPC
ncbi:MAG TPA: hypothetical protein VGD42_00170 [Lysobacter sp.]